MSIIAYPLEDTEYTAEDVQSYLSTRTSGVYSDEITLTPEGMTATISPFLAWFNYAKFKGCSVAVTEPETLTFSPAVAALDRIDRIVLRLDFSLNKAYFTILEGVASSTPIPPEITKTEAVNDISPFYVRIKAGATEITPADITSTILDESVCGIMRDGVTGIPTSQLQSQAEALILRLHEAITKVQTGSAFMIGEVYDPQGKAKPVAFDDEVYKKDGSVSTTGQTSRFCDGLISLLSNEDYSQFVSQDSPESTDYKSFKINKSGDVANAFKVREVNSGVEKDYQIYGEHNKPMGTFNGNGASNRSVSVGGTSKLLALFHNDSLFEEVLFVSGAGAASTSSVYYSNITFVNGVLRLKNAQGDWNTESLPYRYICL